PKLTSTDKGIGIFGHDRTVGPRDVIDGTADTMLLVETSHDLGPWIAGGPPTVRGLDPAAIPLVGARGQFGGIHSTIPMAMADASVRQIDPGTNAAVLTALVTIAGGD